MILKQARCDYVRLTTFDKMLFLQLRATIASMFEDEEFADGNFLQYQGQWGSHSFHGEGIQGDSLHWLCQVSGEPADTVLSFLCQVASEARCTRIDFQITIPKPEVFSARGHADMLRRAMWPHRKRRIDLIDSNDGLDTVYIGNRQSDRFIRLYVKEVGGEQPLAVRFEIEYGGDVASLVYDGICKGELTANMILRSEFNRLPILETPTWLALERVLPAESLELPVPKNVPDTHKTLRWLMRQVTPAIKRMLNDHDYGYRTIEWLKGIIEDHERTNRT